METIEPSNRCIHCDFSKNLRRHDKRLRRVRDMNLIHKYLHLLIHVKRWRCQNCKKLFCKPLSSVPSGSHQTYRLQEHIFEQCRATTISYAGR
ncbi:hypothetical protein GWK91_16305 [Virgibacillus sp. MSP4-1]|uniref:transposase family protein n=1 Tax=Virgibacillus sp. MSP4-1 TaxID=2700081 RepID=UPI00137BC303|nr:hypothetical protein GWK91_16305 [Virgibacillus sp. MSP4-1]